MTPSGYETYNGKYDYYVEHKVEPQVVKEQPSEEKKQAAQKFYRTKADRARQVAAKKRIAFLEQKMEENEQDDRSADRGDGRSADRVGLPEGGGKFARSNS